MKKKNLILAAFALMPLLLAAAPVSEHTALRAALNFWNSYRPQSQKTIETMQTVTFDDGEKAARALAAAGLMTLSERDLEEAAK